MEGLHLTSVRMSLMLNEVVPYNAPHLSVGYSEAILFHGNMYPWFIEVRKVEPRCFLMLEHLCSLTSFTPTPNPA